MTPEAIEPIDALLRRHQLRLGQLAYSTGIEEMTTQPAYQRYRPCRVEDCEITWEAVQDEAAGIGIIILNLRHNRFVAKITEIEQNGHVEIRTDHLGDAALLRAFLDRLDAAPPASAPATGSA